MAIIEGTVVGSEAGFYPYEIEQSLRFEDGSSAYLSRTPASAGNRKTWTFSTWVKRGNLPVAGVPLFSATNLDGSFNRSRINFWITNTDDFGFQDYSGGNVVNVSTSALHRDPSAWCHFVVAYDSTQATASDRVKLYVNGVLQTSLSATTYPSLNQETDINSIGVHSLGRDYATSLAQYLDGYQSETHFLDGITVTDTPTVIRGQTVNFIDEFVELKNGVPVPKTYSGSYGTNGFYLKYADGGALGTDSSGNGNNWTPTNLASTDVMLDSPTNNFATLNPLKESNGFHSEGNLRCFSSDNTYRGFHSTIAQVSSKHYAEIYVELKNYDTGISILNIDSGIAYYYLANTGNKWDTSSSQQSYGATYTTGDIIGIAFDADSGTLTFYKNGVSQGVAFTGLSKATYTIGGYTAGTSSACISNFGQDSSFAGNKTPQGYTDANGRGDFYYAPPAGYLALCTANLPEPAIGPNSASTSDEHFNIALYTGDGSNSRGITGVGFQPDFAWVKNRTSGSTFHFLVDAVRGYGTSAMDSLYSSETLAEQSDASNSGTAPYYGNIQSLDADGFTVDAANGSNTNASSNAYVAWNWKANGSGVSNTNGSITSTVSANVDAGFSIVSWQNNNTANQTIGHGLSQTPEFIITKDRDNGTYNWACWFTGFTANEYLLLNTTGAKASYSSLWGSTPTSSVFSIGSTGTGLNAGTDNMIAYVGHSVEGYSKVFSYTGNGSADGPFQNLGFRPAWVLLKRTDSTSDWIIEDGTRSAYNPTAARLNANGADAEDTYFPVDFLSNGFKIRHAGADHNVSGGQYIGIAFASNPFKYSNAN